MVLLSALKKILLRLKGICCIACGTGASKECIGNGCPGQRTKWHSFNHKWQLVSARIKWPWVSHCETQPALTSTFSPTCYAIRAREDEARWEAPNDLRDQIIFGAASPLSKSGEAWDRIAKRPWTCLNWMSWCRVQIFVNPAAEAFGSLLTAWPVLLAVFFIAPELANIASHHRSVQTSNLLVSSGVPRTPVTNETCGHTFQKDGLSSLVRFLTNTRLDSKLGKFSKSETLPNANC